MTNALEIAGRVSMVGFHRAIAEASRLAQTPVTDADSYREAAEALQTIKGYRKTLDDHRRSITRPIDDAKAGVIEMFRPLDEAFAEAENVTKKQMYEWHQADQRARAEQERIAREAQEEEARRAREEARAAEEAGDIETAIEKTFEATMAAAPIMPTQATKVAGVSMRETWAAEVVDFGALIAAAAQNPEAYRQYLMPNQTALNAAARNQKDAMRVPGVRAVATGVVAAGRR